MIVEGVSVFKLLNVFLIILFGFFDDKYPPSFTLIVVLVVYYLNVSGSLLLLFFEGVIGTVEYCILGNYS